VQKNSVTNLTPSWKRQRLTSSNLKVPKNINAKAIFSI
jgi:hypothetical protein